jgi:putative spermidine/putrescine transport system permease protein
MTRGAVLLGAPALLLLLVFFAAPYADMVLMSLRPPGSGITHAAGLTLANYARALSDPITLAALGRSMLMGLTVTALCLLVAFPLALHLARVSERWHVVFYAFIVSPLLVGVLVRNFGWMIILSVSGPLNRLLLACGLIAHPLQLLFAPGTIVLALVHVFVPFMVLPIANALRGISPSLVEASGSLGAGWLRTFVRITLPLSFPGVQAGVILVFVLSVAAYVTPALLGGQLVKLLSLMVVQELTGSFAWPFGAALALLMAVATLLVVALFAAATRRLADRTTQAAGTR